MIVRYLSLSSVFSSVMANLLVAISQTSQEERTQLVSIANVERLRYSEKKKPKTTSRTGKHRVKTGSRQNYIVSLFLFTMIHK